ncbi:GNAT family N-acetyltransferase [Nonomuraea sp. NPDC050310]|uniref:GNAT family N-acetyltransferase n=1 Tax=Nonomuraea sp. NPDC050310 TaxID=3154935 RepID=UPI0033EA76D0
MNELVRDWVMGWAASRSTETPVAEPWGWLMEVGAPGQVRRFVVTDLPWLAELVPGVDEPGTWLKMFVPEAEAVPYLVPGWEVAPAGYMMSTPLERVPVAAREGYEVEIEDAGAATFVRVTHGGEPAARGQFGLAGPVAVMDKVETDPAHQRRGLGTLVMRTLQNHAIERGARKAVLGGTEDGRALYETLGWRVESPLTSIVYKG